jgi:hypothetical protein
MYDATSPGEETRVVTPMALPVGTAFAGIVHEYMVKSERLQVNVTGPVWHRSVVAE